MPNDLEKGIVTLQVRADRSTMPLRELRTFLFSCETGRAAYVPHQKARSRSPCNGVSFKTRLTAMYVHIMDLQVLSAIPSNGLTFVSIQTFLDCLTVCGFLN
jgi:hypothetical protein